MAEYLRRSWGATWTFNFPELHEIFWSMGSRSLWVILDQCLFPKDVALMRASTLQEMIALSSRKKAVSAQKARAFYEAAQKSIGVKQIGTADRYRLRMCLEEVKRTVLTLKDMDRQLKCIVKDISSAAYLMSITGIGCLSAAVFLGELGDPAHFHNARQIVKYAGYDPQETNSGSWIRRKEILCAVFIKLIKVIFALLRDKRSFEDTTTVAIA